MNIKGKPDPLIPWVKGKIVKSELQDVDGNITVDDREEAIRDIRYLDALLEKLSEGKEI